MADDRSWLESLKHYVSAPRRAFEGMARPPQDPNSPVEFATSHPLTAITRQDIENATEAAMGVSGGGMSTKPIRAYHSSPHDFSKFDLAKIGTGEGAQVYGHGLYFAENPAVSGQGGQYWNQFLRRFEGKPEGQAAERLRAHKFNREAAAETVQRELDEFQRRVVPGGSMDKPTLVDARARVQGMIPDIIAERDLLRSGKPVGPRTYEVDIKADPTHMLDWDKPLGAQSGRVIDAMRPQINEVMARSEAARSTRLARGTDAFGRPLRPKDIEKLSVSQTPFEALSGETAYRHMGLPATTREAGAVTSSQRLSEAGVPGIKYLDQGSRTVAEEVARYRSQLANPKMSAHHEQIAKNLAQWENKPITSNYVVFDPSILDIVKKYGLAGLAAPPAIAGAMRDKE